MTIDQKATNYANNNEIWGDVLSTKVLKDGWLDGYSSIRWVNISHELPTEKDADRNGNILVANARFTQLVPWDFQHIKMFNYWTIVPSLPTTTP